MAWASGRVAPLPLPAAACGEAVRDLLRQHHVEAVLGPLLPVAERDSVLVRQMAQSRGRTDFLLLEGERLLPVMRDPHCCPVLLKGAALALTVYPQRTDRWFVDLDILVPRSEVDAVCARMMDAGYHLLHGERDPLFYEKYHLHRMMLGPQGSIVEVHWDLTIPGSVYRHDVAGVFSRATECALGQQPALCASAVDQVLHGVYQNIADGFLDLRRVLDLVLLMRLLTASDWDYLVGEAHDTGMSRALWLTLHNMKLLTRLDVPAGVLGALAPGKLSQRTLRGLRVDEGLLERRAEAQAGYAQMLHLILTPNTRQRCREIGRSLAVGEAVLLDQGHRPDRLPGWLSRGVIGLRRAKYLLTGGLWVVRAWFAGR